MANSNGALPLYKIVLVGEMGVGKSAIYKRFKDNTFSEYGTVTVGVDRWTKVIQNEGDSFKICLWDTAGMERTGSLTSHYYRGSHAIFFVCSIEDSNSLNVLRNWDEEVTRYEPKVKRFLIINKIDLDEDEHQVSLGAAQGFADLKDFLKVYKVSAKTGYGIEDMFKSVLKYLISESLPSLPNENPFLLAHPSEVQKSRSCAC